MHRKIFENHYGIKIPKGYHIHHIDGDHSNNDPNNLEMLLADDHAKRHGFLNNFIMAQSTAIERAQAALRKPEIRQKMSQVIKNSQKHKKSIEARSQNSIWRKRVIDACRVTAKTRTSSPWNKGKKTGVLSQEHRRKLSAGRVGRKWYNDGDKEYFIFPQTAGASLVVGRL